jgi:protease-4
MLKRGKKIEEIRVHKLPVQNIPQQHHIQPIIYEKKRNHKGFLIFLGILVVLFLLAIFSISLSSSLKKSSANVALISINGEIFTGQNYNTLDAAYSDEIVSFIQDASKNKNIKAIIFEINSPGGSAVASQEIGNAVKAARQKGKLTVAVIRELGASGAYWIASSCDYIITSDMAITGSIGVIGSYLDYSGLLERYNITYQRLVGGKYKDIGSPYKNLTEEERDILQKVINQIYENFVFEVSQNRNISLEKTRELATGMFYLGSEAKELGLIDALGSRQDAINYIEKERGVKIKIYEYKTYNDLLAKMYGLQSQSFFWIGKGIGSAFKENLNSLVLEPKV